MQENNSDGWDPQQQILLSAQQGDSFSQLAAADMYYAQDNFDDAFYWYNLAITSFSSEQHDMSDEAVSYTILSAECKLAFMYFNGLGIDTDKAMAFELYAQVARQRFSDAQSQLGMMYAYGDGIPQHFGLGYAWLYAAQVNGDDSIDIRKTKKMIERKLSKEALSNAKKMAEQWVDDIKFTAFMQRESNPFRFFTQWFQ